MRIEIFLIFVVHTISFGRTIHFVNIDRLSLWKSWIVNLFRFKFIIFANIYHLYVIFILVLIFVWTVILWFLKVWISRYFRFHPWNMNFYMWKLMYCKQLRFLNKNCTWIGDLFVSMNNLFRAFFYETLSRLLRNFSFFL